jgi:hypothetical protein
MTKPWVILDAIVNPFTGIVRAYFVVQSKRAAKVKHSHKNRRTAGKG